MIAAALQLEAAARLPGEPGQDALGDLYQSLVPKWQRHATGEYYTPYWLASLLLDEAGYDGDPGVRLLDPACGSGVFLLAAIERAWRRGAALGTPPEETKRRVLAGIHGFDVNPLAVQAARANYRRALEAGGFRTGEAEIPVFRRDALLDPARGTFDLVTGNPPWVRWDHLPSEYREATLPLWKHYGLFSLKGFEARLGGGKKDLSMLFTLVAADRYLERGGKLAFLITLEALKTKGAGEGFRRFRLPDGIPLGVLQAHDFTKIRPFTGATNKTAAILLKKGEETAYPAPYVLWTRQGERLERTELKARPIGSIHGPWQTLPSGADFQKVEGIAEYRAMLGANANPYGVFWLEVLAPPRDGVVRVRNMAEKGKRPIAPVVAEVEEELVYPAVRGADIARWSATPGVHVLLAQDPKTRRGYPETVMRERWPMAFAYLCRFREELLRRALYRKYHEDAGNPFYSQFNIAVETFSAVKVMWKRMSNDLVAAVVSDWEGPLGHKRTIPLETTAFIPAGSAAEAHYLCAVLNSRPAREFVASFSAAGRGFGTPSVIRHIRLPRFDAGNPAHRELSEISEERHREGVDDAFSQARIEKLILDSRL